MPNLFADFILICWPLISLLLFGRLNAVAATFWTIVGGYLLLPTRVSIDFPLIPPLDKESIPVLVALIGCVFIKKSKINLVPQRGTEKWLILILLCLPFITTLTNREPVFDGQIWLKGLTLHDTISAIIQVYLILLPFIIGLQLVKSYEDQLQLFKLLVLAGVFYSLPILFEVRMSPQLHTWIYGFFPGSFLQQMRFDGFRPVVFIGHGLLVAMFVAITLGASALLWRKKIPFRNVPPSIIVAYFFIILLLCKTIGAFVLGFFLALAILWLPLRIQNKLARLIIFLVVLYPALSIFEFFPHQQLVDLTAAFDNDRAQSLDFRFYNESMLLEHAQQKLLFGWGGWGRGRLADSVTDGYWIIMMGQFGIVGFGALFGLAVLSVGRGIKSSLIVDNIEQQTLLVGHSLIVAIIMLDQLPNASLDSWLWLFMGALLGRANSIIKSSSDDRTGKHLQHRFNNY